MSNELLEKLSNTFQQLSLDNVNRNYIYQFIACLFETSSKVKIDEDVRNNLLIISDHLQEKDIPKILHTRLKVFALITMFKKQKANRSS